MPVKIESVNGDFGKVVEVNMCCHQVTTVYKVQDWNETKKKGPHLQQCEFRKPAQNGLVDHVNRGRYADLHYSKVDVHELPGSPIARLGPLGWTCVGPTGRQLEKRSDLIMHAFLTRGASNEKTNVSCSDTNNTGKVLGNRNIWKI